MKAGLKVSELEVGVIYQCQLSGDNVLTILTEPQIVKDHNGDENHIEPRIVGKSCIRLETGDYKYMFHELHDNQLIPFN